MQWLLYIYGKLTDLEILRPKPFLSVKLFLYEHITIVQDTFVKRIVSGSWLRHSTFNNLKFLFFLLQCTVVDSS